VERKAGSLPFVEHTTSEVEERGVRDRELSSYLRIEERELEAGDQN
jgi:hypothetical protein